MNKMTEFCYCAGASWAHWVEYFGFWVVLNNNTSAGQSGAWCEIVGVAR